ncbi:MAG: ClpXP protease specificity-enhancing factor [Desulfovibrionaceae bacterium]|nr:ClpXP protease specificity-enhancing factor [Desulfovibrionaceae bacterium]
MMNAIEATSSRPYLIRALHEWCTDNGLTPLIAVLADDTVRVPREYVQNGEIVLNIGFDATNALKLGNEFIEFQARFAGVPREIIIPVDRVLAIYARENGQGMAFPVSVPNSAAESPAAAPDQAAEPASGARNPIQLVPQGSVGDDDDGTPTDPSSPPKRKRPTLKVVK